MGFKINHRKRLAKLLNLSLDEVNEFLKRINGHLQKHGTNSDEIAKSFFILRDILHRKEQQRIKLTLPLLGFKNIGLKKHRVEIVKLFDKGLSVANIHKSIKLKKDAPSLSTVKRYIKALRDWRLENGQF